MTVLLWTFRLLLLAASCALAYIGYLAAQSGSIVYLNAGVILILLEIIAIQGIELTRRARERRRKGK